MALQKDRSEGAHSRAGLGCGESPSSQGQSQAGHLRSLQAEMSTQAAASGSGFGKEVD